MAGPKEKTREGSVGGGEGAAGTGGEARGADGGLEEDW